MTEEKREAIELVLSNRLFLYSLMHKLFGREPDAEMLNILTDEHTGEAFALLPTATPIPMQSQWGPLAYFGYPVVDRDKEAVYLMASGSETDRRLYVLRIDYTTAPSPLTLYYTEPQDSIAMWQPVLTPDGNLVMAGGQTDSNFTPSARALLRSQQ